VFPSSRAPRAIASGATLIFREVRRIAANEAVGASSAQLRIKLRGVNLGAGGTEDALHRHLLPCSLSSCGGTYAPLAISTADWRLVRKPNARGAPCSRCWSAPNWQVAIFCFASTAKHGPVGQSHYQSGSQKRATRHAEPPELLKLQIHIKAKNWRQKLARSAIKSPRTLTHDPFCVNA
jgi:hypothetical protein